jgi:uncharacterized protein (DUF3820 family)
MENSKAKYKNLKPFVKGVDERRNLKGRPRTYLNELKDQGFKHSEVIEVMAVLLSLKLDELKEIYNNDETPILIKVLSNAIVTDLKNGKIVNIDSLFNRMYGTPKQTSDVNMTMQFKVEAPNEHTKNLIDNL